MARRRQVGLSTEHLEALVRLSGTDDWKILRTLLLRRSYNEMVRMAKFPSNPEELVPRFAHSQGIMYAIKKILNDVDSSKLELEKRTKEF